MEKSNSQQHQEGPVARKIEDETAKLPSDVFLWTSTAAMGVSLALQVIGKKKRIIVYWTMGSAIFAFWNLQ